MKKIKYLFIILLFFIVGMGASYSYDSFQDGKSYSAGDKVESGGVIYECKPWPYTPWCSLGGVYKPGTGRAWDQAWIKGGSSGGSEPVVTPETNNEDSGEPETSEGNEGNPETNDENQDQDQDEPELEINKNLKKPDKPGMSWTPKIINEDSFTLEWYMWWGFNGNFIKLEENGVIIDSQDLTKSGRSAQKGTFELKNKASGSYSYYVYLCDKIGEDELCSKSSAKTIKVALGNDSTEGNYNKIDVDGDDGKKINEVKKIEVSDEIKRIIASAKPIAGIPKIDLNNPNNNPENVKRVMKFLTKEKWNDIFPVRKPVYKYEELLKAIAKFPALCGEKGPYAKLSLDDICKKELASIFAHATQETGGHSPGSWLPDNPGVKVPEWKQGLYFITEVGCEGGGCEYRGGTCEADSWQGKTWNCPVGAKYYGRGAKQLSYNFNYGPFSKVIFGDVNVLLKDPDRVAEEGWLALSSAVWFYMTPQSPKPSMHDVVAGFWKANENDKKAGIVEGFGATINVINGGVECGPAEKEIAQAANRIKYYKEFTREFGIKIDANEVLGCKDQARFPGNGSGSIPTYWERDWSQDGACQLVKYQTPHTIFDENSYPACVDYHFGIKTNQNPIDSVETVIPEDAGEVKPDEKPEEDVEEETEEEIEEEVKPDEKPEEDVKPDEEPKEDDSSLSPEKQEIYKQKIKNILHQKNIDKQVAATLVDKVNKVIRKLLSKKILKSITQKELQKLEIYKLIKVSLSEYIENYGTENDSLLDELIDANDEEEEKPIDEPEQNVMYESTINIPNSVLVGYWHNWNGGDPYYGKGFTKTANLLKLSEVPKEYNVIDISFLNTTDGYIPEFSPAYSETEFKKDIINLQSRGVKLLFSIGGEKGKVILDTKQKEDVFVNGVIKLIDKYNIDGIDLDIEGHSVAYAGNLIPAVKRILNYYKSKGNEKMLTMAPEFPHMRKGGGYDKLITGLDDYYTFINPQYYNQAGDGVWHKDVGYVNANNNMVEFIVYLTKFITEGNGFVKIPADKLVIGLPSTNWAAGSGYATQAQILKAFEGLKKHDIQPIGLMTWSINWDKTNNWDFRNTYLKIYK